MTVTGSCYCGAVRFTLKTAPERLTECNCTYCRRIGGLWAYYAPDDFAVTRSEGEKTFKPRISEHHFCGRCGSTLYNVTPTWSSDGAPDFSRMQVSINARMLEDFDLEPLPVEHLDGLHQW